MKVKTIKKWGNCVWLYPVGETVRFKHNVEWTVISSSYNPTLDVTCIDMAPHIEPSTCHVPDEKPQKIFVICPIRKASKHTLENLNILVKLLESKNHTVYYPPRDTDQTDSGLNICRANLDAMKNADIVYIIYDLNSQGVHFDMGMAYAMGKKIKVLYNDYEWNGGFPQMLNDWFCEVSSPKWRVE